MIVILCLAFFWVLGVEDKHTKQQKKLYNLNKTNELLNYRAVPKDFLFDFINIGIGAGLVALSQPGILKLAAWVILIISAIALIIDFLRMFNPDKVEQKSPSN